MTEHTPEEIVEMVDRLINDIASSTEDIAAAENAKEVTDVTMAAYFADRWARILKTLAENVAELHERVDVLTESG